MLQDTRRAPGPSRIRPQPALVAVSLAGLLLEVAYTRILSYKLADHYPHLVLGVALLGTGSAAVLVASWPRVRRAAVDRVVAASAIAGAAATVAGYVVVARLPVDTLAIWDYGTRASLSGLVRLGTLCSVLFASFLAVGLVVATLVCRTGEGVGRLYFADLAGAGLGGAIALPLIARAGPPAVVCLAALVLAALGVGALRDRRSPLGVLGVVVVAAASVTVAFDGARPDVRPERTKIARGPGTVFSEWGPVVRVDAAQLDPDTVLLAHDGTPGSGVRRFGGDPASLARYETDPRALPFRTLGAPPGEVLIVGAAGVDEILASLRFRAGHVDAVEPNPVTVSLLTDHFAEFTGRLADRPDVDVRRADGRVHLARSDTRYDLIWYVAPDRDAAGTTLSSSAFVRSGNHMYTVEAIVESLEHLTGGGIAVAQLREADVDAAPNRTVRYLTTAREALARIGAADPSRHLLVAAHVGESDFVTIALKRTPFTAAEVDRFVRAARQLPGVAPHYAPGLDLRTGIVARAAVGDGEAVGAYPRSITPVTDDAPFFGHFAAFDDVARDFLRRIPPHDLLEDSIGERVLLALLAVSVASAGVVVLLPSLAARREWRELPARGAAGTYFAALGLGFMLYEITTIPRVARLLGDPTHSLTVTLPTLLVTAAIGARCSDRVTSRHPGRALLVVLAVLAASTGASALLVDDVTEALIGRGLGVRVAFAVAALSALGLCLGPFVPLGLRTVAASSPHRDVYVAWSWAVNGFSSVIGAVLATMLSMTYGFRAVQWLALGSYAIAVAAHARLRARTGATTSSTRLSVLRESTDRANTRREHGMGQVKPIPDGYPRVSAYLVVDGASDAIAFYTRVLDAKERMRMPTPDGRVGHAELEIGDSLVMLADEFPESGHVGPRAIGGTPVTISVYVEDVDATFARALAAGAKELRAVENQFYGDRSGQFEDPFGHRWSVATHVEDVAPDEMARRLAQASAG